MKFLKMSRHFPLTLPKKIPVKFHIPYDTLKRFQRFILIDAQFFHSQILLTQYGEFNKLSYLIMLPPSEKEKLLSDERLLKKILWLEKFFAMVPGYAKSLVAGAIKALLCDVKTYENLCLMIDKFSIVLILTPLFKCSLDWFIEFHLYQMIPLEIFDTTSFQLILRHLENYFTLNDVINLFPSHHIKRIDSPYFFRGIAYLNYVNWNWNYLSKNFLNDVKKFCLNSYIIDSLYTEKTFNEFFNRYKSYYNYWTTTPQKQNIYMLFPEEIEQIHKTVKPSEKTFLRVQIAKNYFINARRKNYNTPGSFWNLVKEWKWTHLFMKKNAGA